MTEETRCCRRRTGGDPVLVGDAGAFGLVQEYERLGLLHEVSTAAHPPLITHYRLRSSHLETTRNCHMFCRSVINQDPALLKRLEMTGVIFRVYVLSLSPSLLSLLT